MNLIVNELLKDEANNQVFRVLWIDEENIMAYLIDIYDRKALPFIRSVREIIDEIIQDELTKIKEDPFVPFINQAQNPKNIEYRDQAWNIIKEMVAAESDIFEKKKRAMYVKKASETYEVSLPTVRKYLRKYWQRGKRPDALLPEYFKSGGKGKERVSGTKKRGRPRKYDEQGINVDEETKKLFRVSIEKYYLTSKKNRLTEAYMMMIREFYAEDYYFEDGIKKVIVKDKNQLPSLKQFRYWYNKEYTVQESTIARQGRKKYEKDFRSVLGSSTAEAIGPGSRYQIDATVGDVYLISRYNPDWIIGRPIIYFVVDVFSRMIVGLNIGLEGPSWSGAMMALANVVTDKQRFCHEHGIDIAKELWPVEHLPDVLLGDRGELEGMNADHLVAAFNIQVENAAPYRADWKGIVEKQFDTIQRKVKPFLPGYIDKDFRERGARDYRLDAKLTIEQFTQLIIKQIIYYNTKHYLRDYVRDEDMIRDDVQPTPLNLWNWGIRNRSGKLRYFPEETVKLHLLPRGQATVTYRGIKFKGMYYSCERALKESWFPTARQKGSWRVSISYDPRNMSFVYLINEDLYSFSTCHLLEHQKRYEGKTLDEIQYLLGYEKLQRSQSEHQQLQKEVDFISDAEALIKSATKEADQGQSKVISKSQKTKSIREHRKDERESRQDDEAFLLGNRKNTSSPSAVIPFNTKESDNDERYARPSIKARGLWHKSGEDSNE
jgi:hypothetical protein